MMLELSKSSKREVAPEERGRVNPYKQNAFANHMEQFKLEMDDLINLKREFRKMKLEKKVRRMQQEAIEKSKQHSMESKPTTAVNSLAGKKTANFESVRVSQASAGSTAVD